MKPQRMVDYLKGKRPTCPHCGTEGLPREILFKRPTWFCTSGECEVFRFTADGRVYDFVGGRAWRVRALE